MYCDQPNLSIFPLNKLTISWGSRLSTRHSLSRGICRLSCHCQGTKQAYLVHRAMLQLLLPYKRPCHHRVYCHTLTPDWLPSALKNSTVSLPAPPDFFSFSKSCSFRAILSKFWAQGSPLGWKLRWPPLPESWIHPCTRRHLLLFHTEELYQTKHSDKKSTPLNLSPNLSLLPLNKQNLNDWISWHDPGIRCLQCHCCVCHLHLQPTVFKFFSTVSKFRSLTVSSTPAQQTGLFVFVHN